MIKSALQSSLTNDVKYRSMAVGNVPSSEFLIQTIIVPSGGLAGITFSNLGQWAGVYKHLQVCYSVRTTTTIRSRLRFNVDSGNNYATHLLFSSPLQTASGTSLNQISLGVTDEVTNSFSSGVIDILDAFNTNKNTTAIALTGAASASFEVALTSGVWMNTAAITDVNIRPDSGLYAENSRFSIYGVTA